MRSCSVIMCRAMHDPFENWGPVTGVCRCSPPSFVCICVCVSTCVCVCVLMGAFCFCSVMCTWMISRAGSNGRCQHVLILSLLQLLEAKCSHGLVVRLRDCSHSKLLKPGLELQQIPRAFCKKFAKQFQYLLFKFIIITLFTYNSIIIFTHYHLIITYYYVAIITHYCTFCC